MTLRDKLMTKSTCTANIIAALLLLIISAAPAQANSSSAEQWPGSILARLAPASSQALLITAESASGFHATLHAMEKRAGVWQHVFPPMPALIGQKGFALPGTKREGDLKTPSGVFALKRTFGYAPSINSRMPYKSVDTHDLWVDDASAPDYNRWTRRGQTSARSFETLKLPDDRYKYVIVIEYNTDPVIKGAGSAIFIHVRRGANIATLGCAALSEEHMRRLLAWLDPAAAPLAVMGTRDTLTSLAGQAQSTQKKTLKKE